MKRFAVAFVLVLLGTIPAWIYAADPPAPAPSSKAAQGKVDPALEAAETREDIKRHRAIAAAHEAAARCREAGKAEDVCMAELAKACKGIAYGKYCGMKHPD